MDFRMRETLRKSRIFLLENVVFDSLCDHLIDQDIFSDSMLDHIKAGGEHVEKIRRMLDYLSRRPDSCFFKFLAALTNSGHQHCANHLQEVYVRSGPTQISDPGLGSVPQNESEPSKPVTYYPSIGNPSDTSSREVPMDMSSELPERSLFSSENSSVSFEMLSSAASKEYGFPETESSYSSETGFGTSYPVQESSAPTEYVPPSPVSLQSSQLWAGGSARPGTEYTSISSAGDRHGNLTVYERHYQSNQSNVYRMESNPRGLALVINNEQFKTMSPRTGSMKDMENLHYLFKNLGFDICHQMNKTAEEMKALLQSFAKYEALGRVDAMAVVILSHGGRDGVIYGKDGHHSDNHAQAYITDEEIRDIFSARNCPLMARKPKLVIIQACRGRNEDMADCPVPRSPLSFPTSQGSMGHDGPSVFSDTTSTSSSRTANMADMCLIHSTVQGYVSYRHPLQGSPFVKVLTDVFREKATHEHLMDMMAEVSQRLSSLQLQEDLRTIPSTTGTLTKKWFLNPLHFH